MWKWIIIIVLLLAAEKVLLDVLEKKKQKEDVADPKKDYSNAYKAKYLLTKNEWHEYKKLKELAEKRGLQICPKVRLLDIVEPREKENYRSLIAKIQSKHVDFVITDENLRIKAILELDDKSHERADRKERDKFVNEVLTGSGYKVIRTCGITETTLNEIDT